MTPSSSNPIKKGEDREGPSDLLCCYWYAKKCTHSKEVLEKLSANVTVGWAKDEVVIQIVYHPPKAVIGFKDPI